MKPVIDSIQLIANKEKRTVVCVMRGCINSNKSVFSFDCNFLKVGNENFLDKNVWNDTSVIDMNSSFTIIAKTTCGPNDEYNEKRGCEIAKKKAHIKLYKEFAKLNYLAASMIARELYSDFAKYQKLSIDEYQDFEKMFVGIELPKTIDVKIPAENGVHVERMELRQNPDNKYLEYSNDEYVACSLPTYRELKQVLEEECDKFDVVE